MRFLYRKIRSYMGRHEATYITPLWAKLIRSLEARHFSYSPRDRTTGGSRVAALVWISGWRRALNRTQRRSAVNDLTRFWDNERTDCSELFYFALEWHIFAQDAQNVSIHSLIHSDHIGNIDNGCVADFSTNNRLSNQRRVIIWGDVKNKQTNGLAIRHIS